MLPWKVNSFLLRVFSKRKEFAPMESKLFPFREDGFIRGLALHKAIRKSQVIFFEKNGGKNLSRESNPLKFL